MTTLILILGFWAWGFLSPVEKTSNLTASLTQAITHQVVHHASPTAKKQSFFQKLATGVKKFFLHVLPRGGKSWVVALILCLFLGTLGIHRLYLGHTATGIVMLVLWIVGLLFLFTIILGFLAFLIWLALGIWALVDLILIITRTLQPAEGSYTD